MRHVAIFSDDLETFDCFGVADYVVEEDWAVFLDPVVVSSSYAMMSHIALCYLPRQLIIRMKPILLDAIGVFR